MLKYIEHLHVVESVKLDGLNEIELKRMNDREMVFFDSFLIYL